MTTKAKYSGLGEAVWVSPLEFSEHQKKELVEICDKPGFLKSVQEIAEDFHADTAMDLATEAEVLATLKDLKKKAREMSEKLREMPSIARLYLNEASRYLNDNNDLYALKKGMDHLCHEASIVLNKKSSLKKGRKKGQKSTTAELQATRKLKTIFNNYELPWNTSGIHSGKEDTQSVAARVLVIIFEAGGKTVIRDGKSIPIDLIGVAEYLKNIEFPVSSRPGLFPSPPDPNAPQPGWDLIVEEYHKTNPDTEE
jgi:hypothetical protein